MIQFSEKQLELLKKTICSTLDDNEIGLFVQVCQGYNLDPFRGHIRAQKRWSKAQNAHVLTLVTSIDAYRLLAERSGKYEGQDGPYWCGSDGAWKDVWLSDTPPVAAKVGVYRAGAKAPIYAVARYAAYVQTSRDGKPNNIWNTMGDLMTSKCAEALALRKAFPADLAGLYTADEMGQADNEEPVTPVKTPDPKPANDAAPAADMEPEQESVPMQRFRALSKDISNAKGYSALLDLGIRVNAAAEHKGIPEAQRQHLKKLYNNLLDEAQKLEKEEQAA